MTDRDLERRLTAYYEWKVEGAGPAPNDLWDGVVAIPEVPRPSHADSRRLILLVAAVLAVLLIGGAVAIGAGLLRLPWLPLPGPEAVDSLPGAVSGQVLGVLPCDDSLADGLVMSVETFEGTGSLPPGHLYLYQDGMLIRGTGINNAGDMRWEQRSMSTDGVRSVVAAIEAAAIDDCQRVPIPTGGVHTIQARTSEGVVHIGLGSAWLRVPTEEEQAAATELADMLDDPLMQVPLAEWTQSEWVPYVHERWAMRINRWEGDGPAYASVRDAPWRDIVLPDGSLLTTFGSPVLPLDPTPDLAEVRCGLLAPDEADAMGAFLGEPLEEGVTHQWGYEDEGGGVVIMLNELLPHEDGCESDALPRSEPRENLIANLRPCDLVPASWRNLYTYEDFGGGWAACESLLAGWLYVSRHPVASDQAPEVVANQFGRGVTTDTVAGRTIYLNACGASPSDCNAAVAISAEPYLVIAVPDEGLETPRDFALEVIEALED